MTTTVVIVKVLSIVSVLLIIPVHGQKTALRESSRIEAINTIEKAEGVKAPPFYDKEEPATVFVDMFIDSVDSINEASMDFTVNVLLVLRYLHDKLPLLDLKNNASYIEIDSRRVGIFWTPDIYFPNEKKAAFHNIMFPNQMLKIYENQTVEYYSRLSITLNCLMELMDYPFDQQNCSIHMMSFSYQENVIQLVWQDLDVSGKIQLPQFELKGFGANNCTGTRRSSGHSCLRADFIFVRNIGYYIVQMYVPCILVVMLSWISFWLNVTSVPGRISLGVLTVLTITTQSSTINATLPRVSYTKAIDIYLSTCLVFVFSALLEFAVANVLSRNESFPTVERMLTKKSKKGQNPPRDMYVGAGGEVRLDMPQNESKGGGGGGGGGGNRKVGKDYASMLDIGSRICFPLVFIVFNIVYWTAFVQQEVTDQIGTELLDTPPTTTATPVIANSSNITAPGDY